MSDIDNENEEESLIPDYIELTADEQEAINHNHNQACLGEIDAAAHARCIESVIEKLVDKIDEQNTTILRLAGVTK